MLSNVTSICKAQVILFPVAQGFKIAIVVKGLRDLPNTCGFPSHPSVKTAIESLSLKASGKVDR